MRATKSGLGCGDDWPHCNGRLAPALETRAEVIEFSHRATAAILGILLVVLVIAAFRQYRSSRYLLWPAVGALGLWMCQALIGALVVWLELEAASVVLHLGTAMSLVALLIYLVRVSSEREATDRSYFRDQTLMRRAAGAAGAVFLLLLLGSYVSGKGAGLVFPDWPLMEGRVVPDLSGELEGIHFLHRVMAAVVGGIVLITCLRLIKFKDRAPVVARLAHIAMGLYAVEILIGGLNVWTDLNSAVVSAHLTVAALIWASLVGAALSLHPGLDKLAERSVARRSEPALEGGR